MTIIRGKSGKYLLSIIFALSLYVTQSFAQEQLTNLPTLYITTENGAPVVDKENYVSGNVVIKVPILPKSFRPLPESDNVEIRHSGWIRRLIG
ncbi:MAG: hypothetical protein ACLSG8_02465 [Barnesiella sp.]